MAFLLFLALNLSVPLYLRLQKSPIPLYARGIGFLEDLFIVLELFLLATVSIPLAVSLGLLIHLGLIFDHALFTQMQLRLRFSYLSHLRYASSFYSSAKELGLKSLIGSSCVLIAGHTVGYFIVYRHFDAHFSLIEAAALLCVGGAAVLFSKRLPKKIGYAVDNLFFTAQMFQKREPKAAATSHTFPNETFHLLDKNYPLWRLTKGFEGEKQFTLDRQR